MGVPGLDDAVGVEQDAVPRFEGGGVDGARLGVGEQCSESHRQFRSPGQRVGDDGLTADQQRRRVRAVGPGQGSRVQGEAEHDPGGVAVGQPLGQGLVDGADQFR